MDLLFSLCLLLVASCTFEYPESEEGNWTGDCVDIERNVQSPILIDTTQDYQTMPISIKFFYNTINALSVIPMHEVYYGHEFKDDEGGYIEVTGLLEDPNITLKYTVANIHFHTRSEHVVRCGGTLYSDMEMHIVHSLSTDTTVVSNYTQTKLVIGVLFDSGAPNGSEFISQLIKGTENLNLKSFIKELGTPLVGYHYNGSLTTPPCSKIVNWMVMAQRLMLTQTQYEFFHNNEEFKDLPNARAAVLFHDYDKIFHYSFKYSGATYAGALVMAILGILLV